MILTFQEERSPEKEAINWIKNNVPISETILCHPSVLLHIVGIPNTTINGDVYGLTMYVPGYSAEVGEEIISLFGTDLRKCKKEKIRFADLSQKWDYTKNKYLHENSPSGQYNYAVEPSNLKRIDDVEVPFENQFIRVYRINH